MRTYSIELMDHDLHQLNRVWWKQLMSLFFKPGRAFEIRCWREKQEAIAKALTFGTLSERDGTDYEVSVKGTLDGAAIHELLEAEQATEDDRMTAFFTIRLEGVLSCEHYGTEIYLFDLSEELQQQVRTILEPVKGNFSFRAVEM